MTKPKEDLDVGQSPEQRAGWRRIESGSGGADRGPPRKLYFSFILISSLIFNSFISHTLYVWVSYLKPFLFRVKRGITIKKYIYKVEAEFPAPVPKVLSPLEFAHYVQLVAESP